MAGGIVFRAEGLARAIKAHEALPGKLDQVTRTNVKRTTLAAAAEIRALASGPVIKVRSGRYRASVRHRIEADGKTGYAGPNVEYAAQIEYGGKIRPKNKDWLTIPLRGAKTRAGVLRGGARQFRGTFFHRTADGRLFLLGSPTDGSDSTVLLFRLVKEVNQKGKRVVGKARENIAPQAGSRFRTDVRTTLRATLGGTG